MKFLTSLIVILFFSFSFKNSFINETLDLGKKASKTDLKMLNIDNKKFSLNDLKKKNGLLVIFSCNTCPFVLAWQDRYNNLKSICEKNNLGMVLINSNEAERENDDSFLSMQNHAEKNKYTMPYLLDTNSELADAFGANKTPHVFLLNKELELTYRGAIDNNQKKLNVTVSYLENAITSLIENRKIEPNDTKSIGCSIKRL